MDPRTRAALAARVAQAAASALSAQGHVSAIDVMTGIGWLSPAVVAEWRTRRLPFLEAGIQANLNRVSEAMRLFRAWAVAAKLSPSETAYVARSAGRERLRFSKSGAEAIERAYRTHWVSPKLSAAKRARTIEKANRPPELVAVAPRTREWKCHRCSGTSDLLVMEPPGPACLSCVGLGDLEMLPSGDAQLTRRARAGSEKHAVVVRWSRSRKRYERIGTLVETAALERARAAGEPLGTDVNNDGPIPF